jgi:ADP-heptose:LPS heptosyltransferase
VTDLPADPRRILLVRLSSLGDTVCAMPLALALARRYPRARLLWAVEPDAAPLLAGHASGAEPVIVPRTGGLGHRGRALALLRSIRPDVVVDCQGNAKSGAVARIAARGAPVLGFSRRDAREWSNLAFTTVKAPDSRQVHSVRRNLSLLGALGGKVPAGDPEYGLAASAEEIAAAGELLRSAKVPADRPLVLVHPGRLRDVRAWTADGCAALAEEMVRRGRAAALEGPDPSRPAAARERFRAAFAAGVADLTEGVPLRLLVGLCARLAAERREKGLGHVLVSPDTLLPHLAAAVGLPVVLLAGPQDPERTGPCGGRVLTVDAWEGLPCAPCRKRSCHYDEPRACMRRIPVADVAEAVERLANGGT